MNKRKNKEIDEKIAKHNAARKPPKKADQWTVLVRLIQEYAEACIVESWKGGGDPAEYDVKELQLKLARAQLNNQIARLKADSE